METGAADRSLSRQALPGFSFPSCLLGFRKETGQGVCHVYIDLPSLVAVRTFCKEPPVVYNLLVLFSSLPELGSSAAQNTAKGSTCGYIYLG